MTEREALYHCITTMWEYALSPLPDDPTLEARKRDQAVMRALVSGEVLPTTKHQLFNRTEKLPLNTDERQRIKDAQTVLESLCPKYTDAFSEYDRDGLTKWIGEVEAYRAEQIQERRDVARLAHITEVQDHLFFALELVHRLSPDPAIRKRIEDETRAIRDQWNQRAAAPDKKRGYAGMADRAQATCDAYVKLLNELYEMKPAVSQASIEQNRVGATPAEIERIVKDALIPTQNGVDWLVQDRKKRMKANVERGTENQAKGDATEMQCAAADMEKALNRVHDDPDVKAGKHGALLAACRRVCREFKPLTNKKNEMGKYEQYAPLTKAGGEKVKPETLATNYRKKYGARQPRKVSRRAK